MELDPTFRIYAPGRGSPRDVEKAKLAYDRYGSGSEGLKISVSCECVTTTMTAIEFQTPTLYHLHLNNWPRRTCSTVLQENFHGVTPQQPFIKELLLL